MRYASFDDTCDGIDADMARLLGDILSRQPRGFRRAAYRQIARTGSFNALLDALNDFAPPYAYFGRCATDTYRYHVDLSAFAGPRVSDSGDLPRGYRGEYMLVSDHGNATLMLAMARGRAREIWAIV